MSRSPVTRPTRPLTRIGCRRSDSDRLAALVREPQQHLADLYGFGQPTFDGIALLRRLKHFVDQPDAEALLIMVPGQPAVLEAFLFRIAVDPAAGPGLRVRLRLTAEQDVDVTIPLTGSWSTTVDAGSRFASGLEVTVHPSNGVRIEPPTADAALRLTTGLQAARTDGSPMILIGQAGGSRLEIGRFATRLPITATAAAGAPSPAVKLGAEVELKGGRLVIDASQSDGFVRTLLGGVRVESGFDLGAFFDPDGGFRLTGSATIEIAIPTSRQPRPDLDPHHLPHRRIRRRCDPDRAVGGPDRPARPARRHGQPVGRHGPNQLPVGGRQRRHRPDRPRLQGADRRRPGGGRRGRSRAAASCPSTRPAASTPARWS